MLCILFIPLMRREVVNGDLTVLPAYQRLQHFIGQLEV